jgi:hypothetical protein
MVYKLSQETRGDKGIKDLSFVVFLSCFRFQFLVPQIVMPSPWAAFIASLVLSNGTRNYARTPLFFVAEGV